MVNTPHGEAWGNILRIGQLPFWVTASSNNNNNDDPVWCNHVHNVIASLESQINTAKAVLDNAISNFQNQCGTFPCNNEWNAVEQKKLFYYSALAAFLAVALSPPPISNPFTISLAATGAAAARSELDSALIVWFGCNVNCQDLENNIESRWGDLKELHNRLDQWTDILVCDCLV